MATNKDLQTQIAVHSEKIETLEKSVSNMDSKLDIIDDKMTEHTLASQKNTQHILMWVIGGMGTIILFLIGMYFK